MPCLTFVVGKRESGKSRYVTHMIGQGDGSVVVVICSEQAKYHQSGSPNAKVCIWDGGGEGAGEGAPESGGPAPEGGGEAPAASPGGGSLDVASNQIEFDGSKWLIENAQDMKILLDYVKLYEKVNKDKYSNNYAQNNMLTRMTIKGEFRGLLEVCAVARKKKILKE